MMKGKGLLTGKKLDAYPSANFLWLDFTVSEMNDGVAENFNCGKTILIISEQRGFGRR